MGDCKAVIGFNMTKGIRNKNTNWVFVVGFCLPSDVTYTTIVGVYLNMASVQGGFSLVCLQYNTLILLLK